MRIDRVYIKDYKNLQDFTIDLDETKVETVLLGQNAMGKSNFIESLILIFKYLDLEKAPPFEYKINYSIRQEHIEISYEKGKYTFIPILKAAVKGKVGDLRLIPGLSQKDFFNRKDRYLPKYVFAYYSGISNKLKDHFDDHQKRFYDKSIKGGISKEDIEGFRRLFYVQLIHSYFVLLAYYSFKSDEGRSRTFLKNVLGIEDLDSILFVLHKPNWKGKGDKRFWGAKGYVEEFLKYLWDHSLGPIYHLEKVKIDFRRSSTRELLYLFIRDKKYLRNLASIYNSNTDFFKALESTYISDLIEEVRVRVRKTNVPNNIMFKELSEGEQQLLTVLGLMRFTKDEETLFLLDEPDTHLNPLWKWKYREYLKDVVDRPESTQIIINTHDPLLVGGMLKEEVRIFRTNSETNKIEAVAPDIDPKGLGVAGVLTSELFGLPTTLDEDTQNKLELKRELQLKLKENKISKKEKDRLEELESELEGLGFSKYQRDPLYQKFIEATLRTPELQKPILTKEDRKKQDKIMVDILNDILKSEV